MTFGPGDRIHLPGIGTGEVREVRSGGRCVVVIKNVPMIVPASRLQPAAASARKPVPEPRPQVKPAPRTAPATVDLHGRTVAEAEAIIDAFLNDALVAGLAEVRIIHGRSGGRVKAAAHARLERISAVRGVRIDPANPGVTVVDL